MNLKLLISFLLLWLRNVSATLGSTVASAAQDVSNIMIIDNAWPSKVEAVFSPL